MAKAFSVLSSIRRDCGLLLEHPSPNALVLTFLNLPPHIWNERDYHKYPQRMQELTFYSTFWNVLCESQNTLKMNATSPSTHTRSE